MLDGPVAALTVLVVTDNLLRVGQPLQEVGILVGHYNLGLLAHETQTGTPSQHRADGIAVGAAMTDAQDGFCMKNKRTKLLARLFS